MATFNNGLYTPFEATPTPVASPVAAQPTAAPVNSPTPSPSVLVADPVESTPSSPAPISIPATTPPTATTPRAGLSSAPIVGTPLASFSFASLHPTISTPLPFPTTSLAPNSTSTALPDTSNAFKVVWLTPLFIILPGLLFFSLLGWTYGRYWGKGHSRSRGIGFSRGGSSDGRGILSPEEEGGLVEGKWVGDENEKGTLGQKGGRGRGGWASLFPQRLGRMMSTTSSNEEGSEGRGEGGVRFLSVPYTSLDAPFDTPGKSYLTASAEEHVGGERGWSWGTKPDAVPIGQAGGGQGGGKGLTGGWRWASKRYRAKSASSKSASSFGGGKDGGASTSGSHGRWRGHGEMGQPSPSMYSPTVEGHGHEGMGTEAEMEAELNAVLGESRTGGGGDRARRMMNGQATEEDYYVPSVGTSRAPSGQPTYRDERYFSPSRYPGGPHDPSPSPSQQLIPIDLPTAPLRSHPSPTKKSRAALPQTPTKSTPLLFSYDSPSGPTSIQKPYAPRAVPPPSRSASTAPLSPDSQPHLFFSSPTMNPGVPMPSFGGMKGSESNYSLTGVRDLVFGRDDEESGVGLRDLERQSAELASMERWQREEDRRTVQAKLVRIPPTHREVVVEEEEDEPREKFNPTFEDAAPLTRFSPSRVRYAVEELESATAAGSPPPSPSRNPTMGSNGQSPFSYHAQPILHIQPSPRLPIPPSPTKLSRSTTLLLRQEMEEEEERSGKLVGNLVLQRSKTTTTSSPMSLYSQGYSPYLASPSPASSSGTTGHGSSTRWTETTAPLRGLSTHRTMDTSASSPALHVPSTEKAQPSLPRSATEAVVLSQDSRRLSAMLRRGSEAPIDVPMGGGRTRKVEGSAAGGGGGLEAMLRRSMPAPLP